LELIVVARAYRLYLAKPNLNKQTATLVMIVMVAVHILEMEELVEIAFDEKII
jgi:hypothetical protein